MKFSNIFFALILGLNVCLAQTTSDDFTAELSSGAGIGGGGEDALHKFQLLPPNQQSQVLEAVIRRLQSLTGGTNPLKRDSLDYVRNAARLLLQAGTDEQIVAALGNLSMFGHAEPDAAGVLASCKGSAGVEIIQKLAEKRLPELESAINPKNEEEKARSNDIVLPFYFLLLRLDGARNPEGPRAAKRLRDQVAAQYVSENGKILVALLDEDMAKARRRNKKERIDPEPPRPEKRSNPATLPETTGQNDQKSAQPSTQGGSGISGFAKVAAIITMVLIAAGLARRFMRKSE